MLIEKSMLTGTLDIIVLSLLSEKEKYGYELIEDIKVRSGDAIQLKSGTLYPLLHSLEAQNLVSSFEKMTEGGKARKYYRLTFEGKTFLEARTNEWDALTKTVNGIIGRPGIVNG